MGKVIYSMMLSLDGFVETADGEIGPLAPDDELHAFANDEAREMGGFLYGRRMYEVMEYWRTVSTEPPTSPVAIEFARIWRATPKIVFSRTLEEVPHDDVRLVRDGIAEEVVKLKAEPGGDLGLGGPDLAASFIRLGLVDEFRLLVMPVVLGGGKPFFPALDEPIDSRLVETRTFDSGVVFLRYERVGARAR